MVEYFATAKHSIFVDANDEKGAELVALQKIAELDYGDLDHIEKSLVLIEPEENGGFTAWFNVSGSYSDYDQDELIDEDPGIDTGELRDVLWDAWEA